LATRLTHVALHVNAIDACIEFYQRYCNLEVTDDQVRGGRRVVLMAAPGQSTSFVLQLMGGGTDKPARPEEDRHFGFAVDSREEVDRLAAMAADESVLLWEVYEAPFPMGYLCAVQDPNGNTVEISCGHLLKSELR